MNFYELGAGLGVVAQAQPRVEIHATARLQSVVARLSVEGLSIESMQQMELDPIDRAKREIDESLHPTPPQTVAKVFAVSGGDVAAGAVEDHALLRAAVQARLDDDRDVAVALLPVEAAEAEGDATLLDAARQFLVESKVPVLESWEAVQDWIALRRVDTPSVPLLSSH